MKAALVVIAEGCEELEAVTIIDLFRRARIQVTVAGLTSEVVTASRGVKLVPDLALADLSDEEQAAFDVVILPGGLGGVQRLSASEALGDFLATQLEAGRLVGAICAAPAALRHFGLLEGKRVTSYPGSIPEAGEGYTYVEDAVVVDGALFTSRGPGTAMDFSLSLIEALSGKAVRDQVEAGLVRC